MADAPVTPPVDPTPPPSPGAAPAVDAAALQAQIDALKAQADENKFAANYWREKAEAKGDPAPVKKPDTPADDADPLDVLAREGKAGLKKLLAQEGFISKAEVDALVAQKAAELTTSDMLKKQYPELDDQNSAFFKDAAPRFREYVALGYSRPEALKAAARDTELEHLKSGKRETPKQREERESREQAQRKADVGKGRSADPEEDDSEELTAQQKKICEAMGVSEEAYIKRAKAGVRLSGMPNRKGK